MTLSRRRKAAPKIPLEGLSTLIQKSNEAIVLNPTQGKPLGGQGEVRQISKQKRHREDPIQVATKVKNASKTHASGSNSNGKEPMFTSAPPTPLEARVFSPNSSV